MIVDTNINDSARNRPEELGGPERALDLTEEEMEKMQGGIIGVEDVAAKVVDAAKTGMLYIHTHEEARGFIKRRFERIDRAFD